MTSSMPVRWILTALEIGTIHSALAPTSELTTLHTWAERAGPTGHVISFAMYAGLPVLFVPGTGVTLTSGTFFGPACARLLNLLGVTLGATLTFRFARHLGADRIAQRTGTRIKRLNDDVATEGRWLIDIVRLDRRTISQREIR